MDVTVEVFLFRQEEVGVGSPGAGVAAVSGLTWVLELELSSVCLFVLDSHFLH